NLVEKNKETIRLMVLIVDDYKKKQLPYTATEIQELRQKNFDNELQKKQNEFASTASKPTLDEINFADIKDGPLEESMDVLLARAMAVRENQLNQVLDVQDTQAASEWIGTSKTSATKPTLNANKISSDNSNYNKSNNVINLKIGGETTLMAEQVVSLDTTKKPRVNFDESNNSVFTYQRENDEENVKSFDGVSILNKFKTIASNKSGTHETSEMSENKNIIKGIKIINDKLDRVLLNQTEILDYIRRERT
ncbi:MAG: hypothetical protein WD512_17715, partial [Candidatus Paceibacterota bacterium]